MFERSQDRMLIDANRDYIAVNKGTRQATKLKQNTVSLYELQILNQIIKQQLQNRLQSIGSIIQLKLRNQQYRAFHQIVNSPSMPLKKFYELQNIDHKVSRFVMKMEQCVSKVKLRNFNGVMIGIKLRAFMNRDEDKSGIKGLSKLDKSKSLDGNTSDLGFSQLQKTNKNLKKKKEQQSQQFQSFQKKMSQLITQHQGYLHNRKNNN